MTFLSRAAQTAQYEYFQGRCGNTVLDNNHRLILRVVDEGYIQAHNRLQKKLRWLELSCSRYFLLGWLGSLARLNAERNARVLREHLLVRLQEGGVYIQDLDPRERRFYFRLVRPEEVPVLETYLRERRLYHVTLFKGNDPTMVALTYFGTVI